MGIWNKDDIIENKANNYVSSDPVFEEVAKKLELEKKQQEERNVRNKENQ